MNGSTLWKALSAPCGWVVAREETEAHTHVALASAIAARTLLGQDFSVAQAGLEFPCLSISVQPPLPSSV